MRSGPGRLASVSAFPLVERFHRRLLWSAVRRPACLAPNQATFDSMALLIPAAYRKEADFKCNQWTLCGSSLEHVPKGRLLSPDSGPSRCESPTKGGHMQQLCTPALSLLVLC